jgi:flavin reductase
MSIFDAQGRAGACKEIGMVDATGHRARIMPAVAALQHQVAQPPFGVQASWQRCLETYGLDPIDTRKPFILSESEVRGRIAVLDRSEETYRQGVSELSSLLDASGYEVTLCDAGGVTLLNLPSKLDKGCRNIERPGTTWLETVVGTNGIGTGLWDARPVSLVGDEHFLSCYATHSCAAAPIKDCDDNILTVINITTPSGSVSRGTHALACEVLNRIAEKIGRRLFKISDENCVLVELLVGLKGPGLLAVREEDPPSLLVCVNRSASAHDILLAQRKFAVNILGTRHHQLAMSFAKNTGASKFEPGEWTTLVSEALVLSDAEAIFDCELTDSFNGFSHTILLGKVLKTKRYSGDDSASLIWHGQQFRALAELAEELGTRATAT